MALALNSSGIVLGVQLQAPNLPAGLADLTVKKKKKAKLDPSQNVSCDIKDHFKMDTTMHYRGKLH